MGKINSNNIFSLAQATYFVVPLYATSNLWKGIRVEVPLPVSNLTKLLLIHAGDA